MRNGRMRTTAFSLADDCRFAGALRKGTLDRARQRPSTGLIVWAAKRQVKIGSSGRYDMGEGIDCSNIGDAIRETLDGPASG